MTAIKKPTKKITALTAKAFFTILSLIIFFGLNLKANLLINSDNNPKGHIQEQKIVPIIKAMAKTSPAPIRSPGGIYRLLTITCKTARGSENIKLPICIFKKLPQTNLKPLAFKRGTRIKKTAIAICIVLRQTWILF